MTAQHIFTQISERTDRERIFARLISERAVFSFQIDKRTYQGRAFDRNGRLLVFDFLDGSEITAPADAIVSISLSPEMYFMRTKVTPKRGGGMIDLGGELYKVQRRDNFRLLIPVSYKARFELRTIDVESVKGTYPVVDLSGGGLSFEMLYAGDSLKAGSQISGVLKIGETFSKPLTGSIRHVRSVGSMGSGMFRCGMQFDEMPVAERDQLVSLVMKIHREAFSKFKIA